MWAFYQQGDNVDRHGTSARPRQVAACAALVASVLCAPIVPAAQALAREAVEFSAEELSRLPDDPARYESHLCSCTDKPTAHFPYVLVILKTAKGELVARPEGREAEMRLVPLALREGERYCTLDPAEQCYGNFAHPCEFSDFRFGKTLAEFFPTCKPAMD